MQNLQAESFGRQKRGGETIRPFFGCLHVFCLLEGVPERVQLATFIFLHLRQFTDAVLCALVQIPLVVRLEYMVTVLIFHELKAIF
jgi:hypothetical protein